MTTGVVQSVTPEWAGDTLAAATTTATTVLLVGDAGDFEEEFDEPRYLVIGDDFTPRQYVAVANDEAAQQSVTLAAAVGTVFEAGLPVVLWDPANASAEKRAIEYRASVLLDDQGKPIPATIPHEKIPLAGAYSLEGASVRLEEREPGDWVVADVLGRQPTIDANVGVQGTDAAGTPTMWIDKEGRATYIGEIGTAPPGEVGIFLYSSKFSRAGVMKTLPVAQFNVGAGRDQPSIQAVGGEPGLYLYSGANAGGSRESTLRLDNGAVYLGIESVGDDQLYDGAHLWIRRDLVSIKAEAVGGAGQIGRMQILDTIAFLGYDITGVGFQGYRHTRGGASRIYANSGLEVVNPDASAWRAVTASAFTIGSDRSTKTDIAEPAASGLDILRNAPAYQWRYAGEESDDLLRYGVMADDLPLNVAPPLNPDPIVDEDGTETEHFAAGVRHLDLAQMVGVLTMAVQELDAEVQELRAALNLAPKTSPKTGA